MSFSPASSGNAACTYTGEAERTSIPRTLSPEKHASSERFRIPVGVGDPRHPLVLVGPVADDDRHP